MLIFLGICLPVPLFAATGLTIPLPASVERLAASLVPWVETAMVDSNQALLRGTIIFAPGEDREAVGPGVAVVSEHRSPAGGSPKGDAGVKATNGAGAGVAPNPVGPGAGPVNTPDESKPVPDAKSDPVGEDPVEEPGLIETTVDDVGQTIGSTVDGVEATVEETLDPATDDLLGGAQDLLGG